MAIVELEVKEHVALVTLNDGENRHNPASLAAFMGVLDRVEAETDCRVLVVTSAHEKIFCNGIDLDWLMPTVAAGDLAAGKAFFYDLVGLYKRIATLPLITVAAINGHAFAGGAIMACAFDFRFMRSGRGYFCFPEVDLGIPFLPSMNAVVSRAIPRHLLDLMQLTGKRMTAEELAAQHVISKACALEELMPAVMAFAGQHVKGRAVVGELKARMTGDIVHAVEVLDPPYIESGKFQYLD